MVTALIRRKAIPVLIALTSCYPKETYLVEKVGPAYLEVIRTLIVASLSYVSSK
jgi:hypothetical protein